MALLQVNFFSQTLQMNTAINVILPEKKQGIGVGTGVNEKPEVNPRKTKLNVWDGETPLPVLYLLHGASDDHTIWCRRTSIERYVAGKQICVVMPAVSLSFYSNEVHGHPYWDYISQELPQVVQAFFKVSAKREDTFVAGLSMGSYGAMKLALNFPERYAKAGVLSGGMYLLKESTLEPIVDRIYGHGADLRGTEDDLEGLARKVAGSPEPKPEFFFACGGQDFVYPGHHQTMELMVDLGYDVVNHEEEDAYHEWAFWDRMIVKTLDWMEIK